MCCLGQPDDRYEDGMQQRHYYWNVDVSPLDILGSYPHIYALSPMIILLAGRNYSLFAAGIENQGEILENSLELHALLLFQLEVQEGREWE